MWVCIKRCGSVIESLSLLLRVHICYRGCGSVSESVGLLSRVWVCYQGVCLLSSGMGLLSKMWVWYRESGSVIEGAVLGLMSQGQFKIADIASVCVL